MPPWPTTRLDGNPLASSATWHIASIGLAKITRTAFGDCFAAWPTKLLMLGWTFAFFYHLCNGIRHLFWDAGYGFDLKDADRSGWIVIVVSLVATVLSWIVGLKLI